MIRTLLVILSGLACFNSLAHADGESVNGTVTRRYDIKNPLISVASASAQYDFMPNSTQFDVNGTVRGMVFRGTFGFNVTPNHLAKRLGCDARRGLDIDKRETPDLAKDNQCVVSGGSIKVVGNSAMAIFEVYNGTRSTLQDNQTGVSVQPLSGRVVTFKVGQVDQNGKLILNVPYSIEAWRQPGLSKFEIFYGAARGPRWDVHAIIQL